MENDGEDNSGITSEISSVEEVLVANTSVSSSPSAAIEVKETNDNIVRAKDEDAKIEDEKKPSNVSLKIDDSKQDTQEFDDVKIPSNGVLKTDDSKQDTKESDDVMKPSNESLKTDDSKQDTKKSDDVMKPSNESLKTDDSKKDTKESDEVKKTSNDSLKTGDLKQDTLDRYWAVVKNEPSDFTGWTYLLQYGEQQDDLDVVTSVFNAFLKYYPYCYGYWRKYADYLNKHGHKDKCELVFRKGVEAVPLSVDLWIHYSNFMISMYPSDTEKIAQIFEKSLQCCGLDFRSDRLWEAYTKWLSENNNFKSLADVYKRWIAVPTHGYVQSFEKFKQFVLKSSPHSILSPEEFLALRNEAVSEHILSDTISDDAPPGEETPGTLELLNQEESKVLQNKIIERRKEIHLETTKQALARWNYEECIKRPYFHVKPLELAQLKNWEDYLEFEKQNGPKERIIVLYERCLIACALYEKFWINYADYLSSQKDVDEPTKDKIRDIFGRACSTYHKNGIAISLEWAVFEEKEGNPDKAAAILDEIIRIHPNEQILMIQRIYLEKRRRNFDKCHELFKQYIDSPELDRNLASIMLRKYASFCAWVIRDMPLAISVIMDAINKHKDYSLYRQLFSFYLGSSDFNLNTLIAAVDEALSREELPEVFKIEFSILKVVYLKDYAGDINSIQKATAQRDSYIRKYQGNAGI